MKVKLEKQPFSFPLLISVSLLFSQGCSFALDGFVLLSFSKDMVLPCALWSFGGGAELSDEEEPSLGVAWRRQTGELVMVWLPLVPLTAEKPCNSVCT